VIGFNSGCACIPVALLAFEEEFLQSEVMMLLLAHLSAKFDVTWLEVLLLPTLQQRFRKHAKTTTEVEELLTDLTSIVLLVFVFIRF